MAGDNDPFPSTIKQRVIMDRPKRRYWIDEEGEKLSMPAILAKGTEMRSGTNSTTHRAANLIQNGFIVAAAESDPDIRCFAIRWGWYAYRDNYCLIESRLENFLIRVILAYYFNSLNKKSWERLWLFSILARVSAVDYRWRAISKRRRFSPGEIAKS